LREGESMRAWPPLTLKIVEDALRGASSRSAEAGGETWRCPENLFGSCSRLIQEGGGRLLTLSASSDEAEELLLTYTFELGAARTFTVSVSPRDGTVDSLFSRFVTADFLEREVNQLFGVKFLGHPNLPLAGRGSGSREKEDLA